MAREQKGDPRDLQKVRAKKVLSRILSVKAIGIGSLQCDKVVVREAQKLVYASRRLQGPRCH